MTMRMLVFACMAGLLGVMQSGCSPALDWRALRLAPIGLQAWLPCRPDAFERELTLADRRVTLHMQTCLAEGRHYALIEVQAEDPRAASQVAQALLAASERNLALTHSAEPVLGWRIPGLPAQAGAGRWRLAGSMSSAPGAPPREMETALVLRGPHVLQATVLGDALSTAHTEPFFEGLALAP